MNLYLVERRGASGYEEGAIIAADTEAEARKEFGENRVATTVVLVGVAVESTERGELLRDGPSDW
jgi:hypothetical protein